MCLVRVALWPWLVPVSLYERIEWALNRGRLHKPLLDQVPRSRKPQSTCNHLARWPHVGHYNMEIISRTSFPSVADLCSHKTAPIWHRPQLPAYDTDWQLSCYQRQWTLERLIPRHWKREHCRRDVSARSQVVSGILLGCFQTWIAVQEYPSNKSIDGFIENT
jgi:hypothetical protein